MAYNPKEFVDMEYTIVLNVIEYLSALLGPEDFGCPKDSYLITYGINGPEKYSVSEINQILYN